MQKREAENVRPRLKEYYKTAVIPKLMEQFGYDNPMSCPRLEKIVVNVGLSQAREDIKVVDLAADEISRITGQKAQIRRAKKSISNFKLRQGMPIGVKVTMRRDRMYELFDRLVSIAVPRIRDFRGFDAGAFDGHGNYNLGLKEQQIFLEIDLEKADKVRGMNISIDTSAKNDNEAKALLESLGLPFRKIKEQQPSKKEQIKK